MKRSFKDLSAAEVLALAVSLEEEDARLLEEFARRVRPNYPKAAAVVGCHAQGGRLAPAPADRAFSEEVRPGDTAVAAAGRAGLRAPRPVAVGPPLGHPTRPPPGGPDGTGDAAVLHPGGRTDHRRRNAPTAGRFGRRRTAARGPLRPVRSGAAARNRAAGGGRNGPAALSAPGGSAGAGGADGRLGVDAWRRCLPRRSPRRARAGRRFWWGWRPRWGPASAWASPKRSPTTAA